MDDASEDIEMKEVVVEDGRDLGGSDDVIQKSAVPQATSSEKGKGKEIVVEEENFITSRFSKSSSSASSHNTKRRKLSVMFPSATSTSSMVASTSKAPLSNSFKATPSEYMDDSEEEAELQTAIERSLGDQVEKSSGVQGLKGKGKSKKKVEEVNLREEQWEKKQIEFAQFVESFKSTVEANTMDGAEGIENLANIIDLVLDRFARVHFDRHGRLAQYLIQNPETMRMLFSLAKDGILFDVEKWKHVLERCEKVEMDEEEEDLELDSASDDEDEESDGNDEEERGKIPMRSPFPSDGPTLRPSIYLRIIRATVDQHREYSLKLSSRFPAYNPKEQTFRLQLEGLPPSKVVVRAYAGTSGPKLGWSRDEDDKKASKGSSSRYISYISVNKLQNAVEHYEFVLIGKEWLVHPGVGGMRENKLVQDMEEAVISLLGPGQLNQAPGRFGPSYAPQPEGSQMIGIVKAFLQRENSSVFSPPLDLASKFPRVDSVPSPNLLLSSASTLAQVPPSISTQERCRLTIEIIDNLSLHLTTYKDFVETLEDCGSPISDGAFKIVVFGSTTIEVSSRGVVDRVVHGLKDITREDFHYESTGVAFHEKRSGSGPCGEKKISALVRGIPSEHFEVSPLDPAKREENFFSQDGTLLPAYPSPLSKAGRTICGEFGAYFDFWILFLLHQNIRIAMIFWLRHFWIL